MTYSKILLVIVILMSVTHARDAAIGDLKVAKTQADDPGSVYGDGSEQSRSGGLSKSEKRAESNSEKITGGGYDGRNDGAKSSRSVGGEQRNEGKNSGKGSQFVVHGKVGRSDGSRLVSEEIGGYIILSHEVKSKGNGGYHYVGEHNGGGDARYNISGRGAGYNNEGRGIAGGIGGGKRSTIEPIAGVKGISTSSGIKPQSTIAHLPSSGKHNEKGNRSVRPIISFTASGAAKFQNKSRTRTGNRPINTAHSGHGKVNVRPVVGGTWTKLPNIGARPQSSIGPHPRDRGITGNVKVILVPILSPTSSTGIIKKNAAPVNRPQWNTNTSDMGSVPNTSKHVNGQNGKSNGRKNVRPTPAVRAKVNVDPNGANQMKSNRPVITLQNGNSDVGKNVRSGVLIVASKVNSWILNKENTKRSSQKNNGKVNVEPVLVQKSKMKDNVKKSRSGPEKSEKGNHTNARKRNVGSIIGTKNNSSRVTEVDAGLLSREKPNNGSGRRNVGATIGDKHSYIKGSNQSVSSEIGSQKRNVGTVMGEKINNGTSDAGKTEILPGGGRKVPLTVKDHIQPSLVSHARPHQDGSALQDIPLFDILSFP